MIVKQSEFTKEWPTELTPQQRDQLIEEKYQRMWQWYQSQRPQSDKPVTTDA